MASTEGVRPLNMTSFRLLQMHQRMAKMSYHSDVRRYGPSPIELQKASQDESSRPGTLARRQTDEAKEHVMNRCSHSSVAPAQSAHSVGRLVSYASGKTSSRGVYEAKARRRLRSSSVGGSSIHVSIVLKM